MDDSKAIQHTETPLAYEFLWRASDSRFMYNVELETSSAKFTFTSSKKCQVLALESETALSFNTLRIPHFTVVIESHGSTAPTPIVVLSFCAIS